MPQKAWQPKVKPTLSPVGRWQRERRKQLFILASVLVATLAVLGLLAFGYYDTNISPRWQPVGRVNDTVFSAQELVKELRFFRSLGIKLEEQPSFIYDALNELQVDELIRQEARRLGLTVPSQTVEESIRKRFSQGEEGTDEAVVQKRYRDWLKQTRISDADYRRQIESQQLRARLREHLQSQIPQQQEQVDIMVIRVADEDKAKELRARLEGGEDFSYLAGQFSTELASKDIGGHLGWLPRGVRPELDEVAFSLTPGEISQPVETEQGWFLLKVWERQVRELGEKDLQELEFQSLPNWVKGEKERNLVESYPEKTKVWGWIFRRAI